MAYYKGSLFLPRLNNEIAINRNETYRKRLQNLNHLVLVMVSYLYSTETVLFVTYSHCYSCQEKNELVDPIGAQL